MSADALPVAVRAYTRPVTEDQGAGSGRSPTEDERHPTALLVLDTETTTDASQRLLFASYRIFGVSWEEDTPELSCLEEGIVHEDDLASRREAVHGELVSYVRTHAPAIDPEATAAQPNLRLRPLSEFLEEVWRPLAVQARGQVVCFNMPFDLSRLASHWGIAGPPKRTREEIERGDPAKRSPFEGGFSLALIGRATPAGWKDNPAWKRLRIKHIDSKRALKGFGSAAPGYTDPEDLVEEEDGAWSFRGHLLDLRTLVFALTDRGHTLESACAAFGVPYTKRKVVHGTITRHYIDYNREDVEATATLWGAAMAEYLRHPIGLQATRAYSPASVGKAYLRAMGVTPPRERLGKSPARTTWEEVLGFAMVAYYGGRAECRIRRVEVPVVMCDFTSMYPSVQTLMGLERLLTCEAIDAVEEDPGRLMRWVGRLSAGRLFDRRTWRRLNAICLVAPLPGDVFPIRARYQGPNSPLGIGVNEWAEAPPVSLWYTLPDIVDSFLQTGKLPRILRVIRFVPRGEAQGLRPVRLRGEVEADLRSGRFFATVIERRARLPTAEQKTGLGLFLKVLANSASYGIFAEMNRHELPGKRTEQFAVHGLTSFELPASSPESPGEFFFSPTAALVTGAARLMLGLLEHEVAAAGGTYAFCDTDSMAIVASGRGGRLEVEGVGADGSRHAQQVRALSWRKVREIVARFDALNPYRRGVVNHLLKIEGENFAGRRQRELRCFAISAKRYRLSARTRRGGRELVTVSDSDDLDADDVGSDSDAVVKRSEHGLGHLLRPIDPDDGSTDWIEAAWDWIPAADLGVSVADPPWLDLPAVTRTQVATPGGMGAFGTFNRGKDYAGAVKPFNFLLSCYADPIYGLAPDGEPVRLVAPYERDPAKWIKATWYDVHTGRRYRITTVGTGGPGVIRVRTYREILEEYRTHEEAKSVGPDGLPCGRRTRGLLSRRGVRMEGRPLHVGKESNRLEERMRGEVGGETDYLNVYAERLCACGCREQVSGRHRYVNEAHKQKAFRARGSHPHRRRR